MDVEPTSLVFFGNERLASGITTTAPLFTFLLDNPAYNIEAVVLSQAEQTGRSRHPSEVEQRAAENNIPVLKPDKLVEISDFIAASKTSLGILAAFGRIVPQATIDAFEHGIINLHPSLLPEGRGSTPIESAILNGLSKTGMSLMQLVKEMDAGPILGFSELPLNGNETKQDLYDSLSVLGVALLETLLPSLLDGSLTPLQQDHDQASYTQQLSKDLSPLDFSKPAEQLERQVRAFAGWPKSRTTINGKDVVITAASVTHHDGTSGTIFEHNKKPAIQTKTAALVIERLVPAGKAEMSGEDFVNGYGL